VEVLEDESEMENDENEGEMVKEDVWMTELENEGVRVDVTLYWGEWVNVCDCVAVCVGVLEEEIDEVRERVWCA
jgi:hypothetical protein